MKAELIHELVTVDVIATSSAYATRAHIVDLFNQLSTATARADRAEWGWRPIAEMEKYEEYTVFAGKWVKCLGAWDWAIMPTAHKTSAEDLSYTHFYRPQLPPPPAREEVGNG